jgi:hypothetical protein
MDNIDCFSCKHFYITWDRRFPYGCKALGFKSRSMPSAEVYNASSQECLRHEKKINLPKHSKSQRTGGGGR